MVSGNLQCVCDYNYKRDANNNCNKWFIFNLFDTNVEKTKMKIETQGNANIQKINENFNILKDATIQKNIELQKLKNLNPGRIFIVLVVSLGLLFCKCVKRRKKTRNNNNTNNEQIV